MAYGNADTLRRMIANDPTFDMARISSFGSDAGMAYHVVKKPRDWEAMAGTGHVCGQGTLKGQCAVLVQEATDYSVQGTRFWIKGPRVKGNREVPRGAAVAAGWNDAGLYESNRHGNTAMIFLRHVHHLTGFVGLHQWKRDDGTYRPLGLDTIRRSMDVANPEDRYVTEQFYVILTVRHITQPSLKDMENTLDLVPIPR